MGKPPQQQKTHRAFESQTVSNRHGSPEINLSVLRMAASGTSETRNGTLGVPSKGNIS